MTFGPGRVADAPESAAGAAELEIENSVRPMLEAVVRMAGRSGRCDPARHRRILATAQGAGRRCARRRRRAGGVFAVWCGQCVESRNPDSDCVRNRICGAGESAAGEHAGQVCRHVVAVPLRHRGVPVGTLDLHFDEECALPAQTMPLLRATGELIGVALENARLNRESLHASLTGERQMMANEVHDSLAQGLTYMRMRMSMLRDAIKQGDELRAVKYWGDVDDSLTNAHARLRELITCFRSSMDPLGLQHALAEIARTFFDRTGITLRFANRAPDLHLPVGREVQAYHIVQEALANVCNHAKAGNVTVSLDRAGELLRNRRRRRWHRRGGRSFRCRAQRHRPLRHRDHARARTAARRRPDDRAGRGGGNPRARTISRGAAANREKAMNESISVVLIDDHGLCRRGLSELLTQRGGITVHGNTGNADEAVRLLRDTRPDLAIVDLRMAPTDGFALITRLRAEGIDTPILVLTMSDSQEDFARAFRAGVRGYLLKDMDPDEVVDAIRRTARGEVVVCPTMAVKLVDMLLAGRAEEDAGQLHEAADRSRARDPPAADERQEQQGDRAGARHQPRHRQAARSPHSVEARAHLARRSGGVRGRAPSRSVRATRRIARSG